MPTDSINATNQDFKSEEWRPVIGYEGLYEVSSLGRVKSVRPSVDKSKRPSRRVTPILKPRLSFSGYHRVGLSKEAKVRWFTVHSLVAGSFIGPRPKGLEINHRDGVKLNNHPVNLEYVTRQDNQRHAGLIGLMPSGIRNGRYTKPESTPRGSSHGMSHLTEDQVKEIRLLDRSKWTLSMIAERYEVGITTAHNVLVRNTWKHIP